MNSKLTLSEIAVLLAERSGKDKKLAEQFLREFITVVTEGLYTDKIVKVKGLGTFKIIPVEQRESVHVNTGKRFIIPSHYKYSFLPDKELKDTVNAPFAFFETTEIGENIDFSDLEEVPEDDAVTEDESIEEDTPAEVQVENTLSISEESLLSVSKEEKEERNNDIDTDSKVSLPIENVLNNVEQKPENNVPEKSSFYKRNLLLVAILLLVFINTPLIIYQWFNQRSDDEAQISEVKVEEKRDNLVSALPVQKTDSVSPENLMPLPSPSKEKARKELNAEPDSSKTIPVARQFIDQVAISSGDRLTLISLKYYGHKFFWVYIYEANKDIIKDPNNIPIGTVIKIPAPEIYGIDAKNKTAISKAAILQTKILEGLAGK